MFATDINSPNLKANKHSCCPFPFHLRQISITFCKIRFFYANVYQDATECLALPFNFVFINSIGANFIWGAAA